MSVVLVQLARRSFCIPRFLTDLGPGTTKRWQPISRRYCAISFLLSRVHHAGRAEGIHHGMEGFFATSNGSYPNTTIGLPRFLYRGVAFVPSARADSVATTSAEKRPRRRLRLERPVHRGPSEPPVDSASGEESTSSLETTLWDCIRSRCAQS